MAPRTRATGVPPLVLELFAEELDRAPKRQRSRGGTSGPDVRPWIANDSPCHRGCGHARSNGSRARAVARIVEIDRSILTADSADGRGLFRGRLKIRKPESITDLGRKGAKPCRRS